MHADSNESNIADWDALSSTEETNENNDRTFRNHFIDDEAIEDNEASYCMENDAYEDVGGNNAYDDDEKEQEEVNDVKLSSFQRYKRRRLTTLLDSE